MGKLSDALRKSMQDRERQRQLEKEQLAKQPPAAPKIEEDALSDIADQKQEFISQAQAPKSGSKLKNRLLDLKNRIADFTQSATYVAKTKDDSGIDPRVVAYYNYRAPIVDQYRIIRTNLKSYFRKHDSFSTASASPGSKTKIITISSALHGEGKSITAANLAIVLAHDLDSKVLLFDCDLRRASASKLLNVNGQYGLSDILTNKINYNQAIYPTRDSNLFVMPSGQTPAKTLELLSSKRMKLLFEQLRAESFTYIVVDTPPLSLFSDAAVVGSLTDGIVFVAQAYKTPVSIIKRAKELAETSHSKVIGFVLTHTDYHIQNVYGYHQYYKYYSRKKH